MRRGEVTHEFWFRINGQTWNAPSWVAALVFWTVLLSGLAVFGVGLWTVGGWVL